MDFTTTHKSFDRTNNLNNELFKDQLTPDDMKEINDLDDLIIKGMLASEGKIRNRQNHYPWFPILEQTILEVSWWKLIISEIKMKYQRKYGYKRSCHHLSNDIP